MYEDEQVKCAVKKTMPILHEQLEGLLTRVRSVEKLTDSIQEKVFQIHDMRDPEKEIISPDRPQVESVVTRIEFIEMYLARQEKKLFAIQQQLERLV